MERRWPAGVFGCDGYNSSFRLYTRTFEQNREMASARDQVDLSPSSTKIRIESKAELSERVLSMPCYSHLEILQSERTMRTVHEAM